MGSVPPRRPSVHPARGLESSRLPKMPRPSALIPAVVNEWWLTSLGDWWFPYSLARAVEEQAHLAPRTTNLEFALAQREPSASSCEHHCCEALDQGSQRSCFSVHARVSSSRDSGRRSQLVIVRPCGRSRCRCARVRASHLLSCSHPLCLATVCPSERRATRDRLSGKIWAWGNMNCDSAPSSPAHPGAERQSQDVALTCMADRASLSPSSNGLPGDVHTCFTSLTVCIAHHTHNLSTFCIVMTRCEPLQALHDVRWQVSNRESGYFPRRL